MPDPQRRCPKCGAAYGASVLFCPVDGAPLSERSAARNPERYLGLSLESGLVIETLIGVGAMASVYRARQTALERDVAVKILHAELCRDATLVARFQREGRAAAKIRHPNVIEVIASGTLSVSSPETERAPYLVFEYLDGPSLRSLLSANGGALGLPRAIHVALQAADAAGEAHGLRVVHRDLKPENLVLVRRGDDADFVKVLDFGLSRSGEDSGGVETQTGAVLGTARYVSPEGARGDAVGPSADVYSLATLLFECLAGRTPFEGESAVSVLVKQARAPAPDVRDFERSRSTPAPIAELLARCLAKEPERRPADGRDFGRALARAAAEAGLGARELSPRPTLFGTSSSRRVAGAEITASRTEVFGSPGISALSPPDLETRETSSALDASKPARTATPARSTLRRVGFVAACFALGALGALGAGSQIGACGR